MLYFDAASDEFMYLQNVPTRMTGRVLWPSLLEVAMLFRLPYPKNFPNCCQQRLGPRKNTWRQAKQTGLGGKQARWSTPVTIKKRFDITRAVIDKKALTDPFCGDIFGFLGQKKHFKTFTQQRLGDCPHKLQSKRQPIAKAALYEVQKQK